MATLLLVVVVVVVVVAAVVVVVAVVSVVVVAGVAVALALVSVTPCPAPSLLPDQAARLAIGAVGPVSTLYLGYAVLGETLSFLQALGTMFVLAGVLMVSLKK